MFMKYNAVLRGLQGLNVPFLRNTLVSLCCPKDVASKFQGTAKVFETANGVVSFEEASGSLNKYQTTLHGINR